MRRVPVGRKFTSIEVFESVFWTPFAIARRLRPPVVVVKSGGGMGGGDGGWWSKLADEEMV